MYSKAFRVLMVQKMINPAGPSSEVLADEIGVSRASLYRWLKDAAIVEQRTTDPVELPTTNIEAAQDETTARLECQRKAGCCARSSQLCPMKI